MLMTAELTRVQKRLLDALTASGQWHDRDSLAALLNKKILNTSERIRLQELVDMGLVERSSEIRGISTAYVYRVKSES